MKPTNMTPFPSLTMQENEKHSNFGRFMLSDVGVKSKRNLFWDRKWSSSDIQTAAGLGCLHLLCLFAPSTFSWNAFFLAFGLYVITGLFGITLSFHRNLSHRSLKLPKFLEYFFAYCGVHALQGDPIEWVSTHRNHHQFTDSERDPHTPIQGFWFSHIGWLLDSKYLAEKSGKTNNAWDLEKQPFYRFIRKTYILHPLSLGLILYTLGGFSYIVWGMGVRTVWLYHITWLVNSACHIWGKQSWNTGDLSKNIWWMAILSFGDSWHNNHHAFPYSARYGLEWWQLDMTWYVVRILHTIGLSSNIKLPNQTWKNKMALNQ